MQRSAPGTKSQKRMQEGKPRRKRSEGNEVFPSGLEREKSIGLEFHWNESRFDKTLAWEQDDVTWPSSHPFRLSFLALFPILWNRRSEFRGSRNPAAKERSSFGVGIPCLDAIRFCETSTWEFVPRPIDEARAWKFGAPFTTEFRRFRVLRRRTCFEDLVRVIPTSGTPWRADSITPQPIPLAAKKVDRPNCRRIESARPPKRRIRLGALTSRHAEGFVDPPSRVEIPPGSAFFSVDGFTTKCDSAIDFKSRRFKPRCFKPWSRV